MKTTCKLCQRCYNHQEVANAHTVFEKEGGSLKFSSTDDDFGIDICQVCHKPPLVASLWQKIVNYSPGDERENAQRMIRPEVAGLTL